MSMGLPDISFCKEALNSLSDNNLKNIIKTGDEKDASVISKNIIKERNYKQIETTDELVKIIKRSKKNFIIKEK